MKKNYSRKDAKAQSLPGSKQRSLRLSLRLCAFAREMLLTWLECAAL
jgi:hypothetical protein